MDKKTYDGIERRQYFRHKLIHSPEKRLTFEIQRHAYEVIDISQEGLRFVDDGDYTGSDHVEGILKFSDDDTRKIEGTIIWRSGSEIGIKFKTLQPLWGDDCYLSCDFCSLTTRNPMAKFRTPG